jgi:homoaconitase/3-isopropylmalate dehydratase large subunit
VVQLDGSRHARLANDQTSINAFKNLHKREMRTKSPARLAAARQHQHNASTVKNKHSQTFLCGRRRHGDVALHIRLRRV